MEDFKFGLIRGGRGGGGGGFVCGGLGWGISKKIRGGGGGGGGVCVCLCVCVCVCGWVREFPK